MKHVAGTFECNSWDEFIKKLSELEEATAGARTSEPLFRGQPNADWGLVTSLERETSELMTLERYHEHYVTPAFNALSGFHEKQWPFDPKANCKYSSLDYLKIPNYAFMAYLRHHGFPSPLLDWSASPFIATFFAFDTAGQSDKVAIYYFLESVGSKSVSSNKPRITTGGPWIASHKRHFLQQSQYSICFSKKEDDALLISHEEVFKNTPADVQFITQDILLKITLPTSLRKEVIKKLNSMSINSYSVYQSEDSLVKTVGQRLFR